jgi:alcohol dehydrogenase (quinone), cytochrome c subunit
MKAIPTLILLVSAAGAAQAATAAEAPTDRGEYMARAANCISCHSIPNAPPFSGGLKMATPLGAIYTTNITPDPQTGIGRYTLQDFDRAVRLGVAKDGHRLYPAMPYPSYAKMAPDDIAALYHFFMTSVVPANVPDKPSEIRFPLNWRWPLAIWNVFFANTDRYRDDPRHDAAWNRGAYLVQGPGHCGACHTPRGIFFNEHGYDQGSAQFLMGAPLDNWSASDLRPDVNTGLGRWSHEDLVNFLENGHSSFGTAFGTMTEVINFSTEYMTAADVDAMARYLESLPPAREGRSQPYAYDPSTAHKLANEQLDSPGAVVYLQWCMSCHQSDGKGFEPYLPPLAGNPTVLDPSPASVINVVLNGSHVIVLGEVPDAYRMPLYRILLSDQDIASVVDFIRSGWGNRATGVTAREVADMRAVTDPTREAVQILRMK